MLESIETETIVIFTDSSVDSKNRGGIGAKIISITSNGDEIIDSVQAGGFQNVNSGQMEIIACTYVLEEVARRRLTVGKRQIIIFTDAKYVADNYKTAMFHWIGNGWLWRNGRPGLDAREWKKLVKQLRDYKNIGVFVEIRWVKGHDKNNHNIDAHNLAKGILRLPSERYSKYGIISVFRPEPIRSPQKLELGSVKMEGQKVSVKILAIEYLQQHKIWCYKYTVITKKSPYCSKVDKIFSRISLDVGKSYYVKFNRNTHNPRIEKIYHPILDGH